MSSFKRRFSKKNLKWLVTYLLISVLAIGLIFAFAKISDNEDTKTLKSNIFTYSIGCIDEKGYFDDSDASICTKNYYSVDGLTVKLEEKADIVYKLYFYDEDEKFIESSDELSDDLDSSIVPATAEYFRVVITPVDDEEVGFFEIRDYASQLTVTFNK